MATMPQQTDIIMRNEFTNGLGASIDSRNNKIISPINLSFPENSWQITYHACAG